MVKVNGQWKHTRTEIETMSRSMKGKPSWCKGKKRPPFSEVWIERLSESHRGYVMTVAAKQKISESLKGRPAWNKGVPAWNKGLTKETDERVKRNSEAKRGKSTWIKGTHLSVETKEKISKGNKGKQITIETREKLSRSHKGKRLGAKNHMYGKHHTVETRRKMSDSHLGRYLGPESPRWIDGRSFLPYSAEFTRQLKELIRQRDNYQCQRCGCSQLENMEKLSAHHIDYNKKNCLPSNLISLCRRCNVLVNQNRDYWENCFITKLEERGF